METGVYTGLAVQVLSPGPERLLHLLRGTEERRAAWPEREGNAAGQRGFWYVVMPNRVFKLSKMPYRKSAS